MSGRIIVICGPTASGKTALSVALAKRLGGEVVSADSMQIYRRMDIGTAKPTAEEMQGVPHHMLDVADPGEQYSVSRYAEEAGSCVEKILAGGRVPIVCGGTGLYIDGLIRGAGYQPCGADSGLRDALEREWEQNGPERMLEQLRAADPDSAARLHLNDKRRILRALEVFRATGETITAHNLRTQMTPPRFEAVMLGLTAEPRSLLYDRIDRRVDEMLEQGLLREVRALLDEGLLRGTAAQAIGYKELTDYFRGQATLEQAAELIRRKSRNYAKRQLTWFRRDGRIHWIVRKEDSDLNSILQESTEYLRKHGYTGDEKT